MDIKDFQEKLVKEFNTRNVIKIFRTKDVPQLRKQANINTGEVSEKKEESDLTGPIKNEFNTMKKKSVKDWETAKEFTESFSKICNETNKGLTLFSVPEIPPMLKEKNWRMCGECLSSNCQLLQYLSRKNKIQPKFIGNCKGKAITLGEVPNNIKEIEKKIADSKKRAEIANKIFEKRKKSVNGNAAAMEPKASNYSNNVDEFISNNIDLVEEGSPRQDEFNSVKAMPVIISQLPEITEEILPKWEKMKRNKIYSCIICGKKNMKLKRYDEHMTFKHQAELEKPDLEEYAMARGMFEYDLESATEEQLKTAYWDYDSETGKRYSEDELGEECNNDDTFDTKEEVNVSAGYASSGNSSSTSSSGNSSEGSTKSNDIEEED